MQCAQRVRRPGEADALACSSRLNRAASTATAGRQFPRISPEAPRGRLRALII